MEIPKLVIIRGPSGAGKTTVARALVETCARPTALVERDQYMLMFNAAGRFRIDQAIIELVVERCLAGGFNVVFEGNFKPDTHEGMLSRLFDVHPAENYVFYMDVSLEETVRRHDTRPNMITVEKMRELYPYARPLGHPDEVIVPETLSSAGVVALIMEVAGLD